MDFSQLDPRLTAMMGQLGVIAGAESEEEREKQYNQLATMLADVKGDEAAPAAADSTEDSPKAKGLDEENTNSSGEAASTKSESIFTTGEQHTEDNAACPKFNLSDCDGEMVSVKFNSE